MVSAGDVSRKALTERAIVLMCPGVPVTAWASIRPDGSKMAAERSPDSRTIGLNAVRSNVCACSSTSANKRVHMTWNRIADENLGRTFIGALPALRLSPELSVQPHQRGH